MPICCRGRSGEWDRHDVYGCTYRVGYTGLRCREGGGGVGLGGAGSGPRGSTFLRTRYVLHLISGYSLAISLLPRTSQSAARRYPHARSSLIIQTKKTSTPLATQPFIRRAPRQSQSRGRPRRSRSQSRLSDSVRSLSRAAVRGSAAAGARSAARASRLSPSGSGPGCPPDVTAPRPPAPLD